VEAYNSGVPMEAMAPLAVSTPMLRLRGVPFQAEIPDVIAFLANYGVVGKDQVRIGRNNQGGKTGEAFVFFHTTDDAERALAEKQKHEIMGRYIELYRSNTEEADRSTCSEKDEFVARVKQIQRGTPNGKEIWEGYCGAMQMGSHDPMKHTMPSLRNFVESMDSGMQPQPKIGLGSPILRLRGVSYNSDSTSIAEFLSEYGITSFQVAYGRKPDGQKSGEVYVTFPNIHMAERAMAEKQMVELHGRYIELFRSSEEDKEQSTNPGAYMQPQALPNQQMFVPARQVQMSPHMMFGRQ